MADYITIGSGLKLALQIHKQVKMLHQNKQDCQDIEERVGRLTGILSTLPQDPEFIRDPVINAPLLGLERNLNGALDIVADYQRSSVWRRLFRAGDTSKKLRRAQDAIKWEMDTCTFALQLTYMTKTIHYRGAHPRLTYHKIVIKISLTCDRTQSKAMALVASANGVSSVAVTGHGRDQLEVVGWGFDSVCMIKCLRRKIGLAQLLMVQEVKKKPEETNRGRTIEELENTNTVKVDQNVKEKQPRRGASTSKELENTDIVKVEDVREKKPEEPKRGARKSKRGGAAKACRPAWR